LKKLHTLVAVIGIGLAGAAAWWWQRPAAPAADAPAAGPATAARGTPEAGGAPGPGAGPAGGPGGAAAPAGGPPRPGGGPGGGGPASVEVATAETQTIVDDVQAVGSLKAVQGVVVRPEVSGRIARLGFADGQRVSRGQLLVQLDDTLQQAQLKQAQAQASIARTNLARSRELLAQNFVSQSAVDQNAAALQVAEAQVALADAQLARMRIIAPFDGTAGLRSVDVGDYVKDGADIVTIQDLSVLEVEFPLPERYVARIRPGLPVEVAFDALAGRSFRGQIVALNSTIDANGRALQVRARVASAGERLKPGMFARPRVVLSVREGAVVVPEEALVPVGSRQFIYLVGAGPEGKPLARRVEVRVGLRMPGRAEILEGVAAGDKVVTAGQTRLRGDTVPVRVIDLARPPGGAPGAARPGAGPSSSGGPGAAGAGASGSAGGGAAAAPSAAASAGRPVPPARP
jgi:membrane fusion protein (multidrug efflux system)